MNVRSVMTCWTELFCSPDCYGLELPQPAVGSRPHAQGMWAVHARSWAERRTLPAVARRPVARLRDRIETTSGKLTDLDRLPLARHGAKTV